MGVNTKSLKAITGQVLLVAMLKITIFLALLLTKSSTWKETTKVMPVLWNCKKEDIYCDSNHRQSTKMPNIPSTGWAVID